MKTIKQVVGIDISKDTFHVCLGTLEESQQIRLVGQTSFKNQVQGFKGLLSWCKQLQEAPAGLHFVMEATGVYYEELAYFLSQRHKSLSVLLPTKTKYFAKSLDIKSKTDKIDAAMLCRIGLERKLALWQAPFPVMKEIKGLCREHRSLKKQAAKVKVRVHAYNHSHAPSTSSIRRLKQQLSLLQKQMAEVGKEIRHCLQQDPQLLQKVRNIEKINGLGLSTIVTVIAETNGFAAIENAKQLTSYTGLDVVMNQSGKLYGKTRISRKGNRHIRSALYLPAMSAIRYNKPLRLFYQNLMKNHICGKVGVIAVARKLLILIYTLWKNNTEYDPNRNLSSI